MNKFGLSDENRNAITEILLNTLRNKISCSISVFGSRATGHYRKYSDLDLWIASTPPLSEEERMVLSEKFDDSTVSIKIDIVTPESCLPEYQERIKSELVPWIQPDGT